VALVVPATYEHYSEFCHDFVASCCGAETGFEEALDFALKISTDTPEGTKTFMQALTLIQRTTNRLLQEDCSLVKNPDITNAYLRAAKIASQRSPEDKELFIDLGAAYCLAGNNLEGAKCYRQALAPGNPTRSLDRINREHTTLNLLMAQLQCPGMPLEDAFILNRQGRQLTYIHKRDRAKVAVDKKHSKDYQQALTAMKVLDESVDVMQYTMPTDPDDPTIFPASLLTQVQIE